MKSWYVLVSTCSTYFCNSSRHFLPFNVSWNVRKRESNTFFHKIVIQFRKVLYDIALVFKISITPNIHQFLSSIIYISICWLCWFHMLTFDHLEKICILAFIHGSIILKQIFFENDTNVYSIIFNGYVIYRSCNWFNMKPIQCVSILSGILLK